MNSIMDVDSATCQEPAGWRSLLIGRFSLWRAAAGNATNWSAGPRLTQEKLPRLSLNPPLSNGRHDTIAENHKLWGTAFTQSVKGVMCTGQFEFSPNFIPGDTICSLESDGKTRFKDVL